MEVMSTLHGHLTGKTDERVRSSRFASTLTTGGGPRAISPLKTANDDALASEAPPG